MGLTVKERVSLWDALNEAIAKFYVELTEAPDQATRRNITLKYETVMSNIVHRAFPREDDPKPGDET